MDLSASLPAWWASDQIRHDQRKALLRSLIAQVIVTRPATDRVTVKIIWVSGHYSEGTVIPPVLHQRQVTGYDTMVERVGQLWAQGATDVQIAETLSAEGFRSARRDRVLPKTVLKIRRHQHWVSRYHQHRLADKIDGLWTIHGLAASLGVPREWFYNRIRSGFLREPDVTRKPPYGNYLIRDDAELLAQLRAAVQQSRRLRRDVPPVALPLAVHTPLDDTEEGQSSTTLCAMTSRTNRLVQAPRSDA